MEHSSDAELLRRSPDPDAVEAFYRRHVDTVMRFAVRRCATPEDVADLVSITFIEVIASRALLRRAPRPRRPWLLGIATRCLADHLRDRYRRAETLQRLGERPAFTPAEAERVEAMIDAERLAAPLERGLRQLTVAERELLLLVAEEGLAIAEAARALGIPVRRRAHAPEPRAPQAAPLPDRDDELEARVMSTFEDRLATALRAYAAEQEAAPAAGAPRRARGRGARRAERGAVAARRAARRADRAGAGGSCSCPSRPPSPRSCSCSRPDATPRPPRPPSSCARPRPPPSARRRCPPAPTSTCGASSVPARAGAREGGTEERWTRADGSGRTLVRDRSGRVVEDTRRRAGFVDRVASA